ncbi:MAG: hypothetical protein R3F17_04010 [Planctomycetota bacterium]
MWATAAELAVMAGQLQIAATSGKPAATTRNARVAARQGHLTIFSRARGRETRRRAAARALALDPDLPYVKYPLSEAERLYAQELAGRTRPKPRSNTREAVALSPDNLEAQGCSAICACSMRWGEGIEIFESLLAQGRPMETKLAPFCKHAGVVALAQDKKDLALRYFRRAHELGLSESELSSGADVLKSAAGKEARAAIAATDEGDWVTAETHLIAAAELWPDLEDVHLAGRELYLKRGQVALDNRDWPAARAAFEASLGWDDEFLVARHLVGLVSMQQGVHSAAASAWHRLVDQAREEAHRLARPGAPRPGACPRARQPSPTKPRLLELPRLRTGRTLRRPDPRGPGRPGRAVGGRLVSSQAVRFLRKGGILALGRGV